MKTVLGGGGLGDAVMVYLQLDKMNLDKDNVFLTHVMLKETLRESVQEFYDSQNISAEVKLAGRDWVNKNKGRYSYHFKIVENPNWDEITAFPLYNLERGPKFDILISPTAGRDNDRGFSWDEINDFCSNSLYKKIGLIGQTHNVYDSIRAVNMINKTNIQETLNLIAKAQYIIAPAGFVSIVAASMNKCVFTKEHIDAQLIRKVYYHPEWIKNEFIANLNEIEL